jgi:hypothetical protein
MAHGSHTMTTLSPTRITDWDAPRLPLSFRLLNAIGEWPTRAFVSLEPDDLLAAASKQTGLTNFGDDHFREPLEIFLHAVQHDTELSSFGRVATRQLVLQLLRSRLRLEELYRLHPEIEDERIDRPIIVAGLPRTGTTHLLNLLSQDASLRWLPYWESLEPFPDPNEPPGRDGRDPRIERCAKALALINKVVPLLSAMHEFTVEGPHEEIQLLAIDFSSMLFEGSYHVPSYGDWYRHADQKATYGYLKRCMKALQFLRPGERWLLKSPQHLENLDALVATFPDATFIQTHRDPVRITASLTTMVAYGSRMQEKDPDVRAIAQYWAGRAEDLLRAGIRDRELLPESRVMDVHFHDFMGDMQGTVKRILEFAGHPFSEETARAVDAFLVDNPKGKHGLVDYRLEDLGIDPQERSAALAFYRERFNVPER